MQYKKKWISIDQQIQQLKSRGLEIGNYEFARQKLSVISYYRLSGYWWPMQSDKVNHVFKEGSTFEKAIQIYEFDNGLRDLIFSAISDIEIAFRTKLIYHVSQDLNSQWFEERKWFKNSGEHFNTLLSIDKELNRSKEVFIKEHKQKYHSDSGRPPAWKTLEIASFGNLSKLYGNLKNSISAKERIAEELGAINHKFLPSWIQGLTQIRNLCAHHSRLWNKNLMARPKVLKSPPYLWIKDVPKVDEHHKVYIHLCLIQYLLNVIKPENSFSRDFKELLDTYPIIDQGALGMKPNWKNEELWK